jgi:hypothetical protein
MMVLGSIEATNTVSSRLTAIQLAEVSGRTIVAP